MLNRNVDVAARAALILEQLSQRTVIAENDRVTALAPDKLLYLLEVGLTREPEQVLEVGLGWGFSAAGIQLLESVRRHVIIELDEGSARACQGESNVSSMRDEPMSVEIRWGDSHRILPELCEEGARFDLVFIDGGHRYDDVFVDFHFVRRLVHGGSIVVFDDTWLPSIQAAVSWVDTNLADQWLRLRTPPGLSLAAFEARGAHDCRRWDHFIPFR